MSDFQRRDDFIPYNVPDITDAEINEVVETLKSGWVAKGPRTNRFEQEFAGYLGAKHAVAMNSCTAALHIALLAKGIGPGDEVITTPMTFASTASTIIHTGATPVFADIDYRTGCIDPDEIEKKITSRTKAIVPVHYSGQVCDPVSYTHLGSGTVCSAFCKISSVVRSASTFQFPSSVSTHSVSLRRVMHGTSINQASFCRPPESVNTWQALEVNRSISK